MRVFNRFLAAVAVVTVVIVGSSLTVRGQQAAQASAASAVARGKYLVTAQDCNGCHTPFNAMGEPDMTKMLSGHPQSVSITVGPKLPAGWATAINATNTAWSGPWGVSFTSNLTSDKTTGLGNWTEKTFIDSIRNGKRAGTGRTMLPPMPWRMYGQLSDDDLKAIFAYLKTVPAISNRVPNAIIAPPPAAK